MSTSGRTGILVALVVLASNLAIGQAIVSTHSGKLRGVTKDNITSFLGIPYAAPPVGLLRWRPPQPASPWRGVKDADKPGPICPQIRVPYIDLGPGAVMSEDCLYLNLWRPESAGPHSKLPVMVWIHGGGFIFGSGSSPIYNGAKLASQGVIVVNFNYRLGRFGWFAYPELTREGKVTANFGLMDDIAALRWVRDNIEAFGGNPANVTLFGESGGGMSVNALMTVPAAKGLFAKAITESGLGRTLAKPLALAEQQGRHFAESAGAHNLAELRKLSADMILGASTNMIAADTPGLVLDGTLMSQNVAQAFAAGAEAKVPWIVGSNNFEASLFGSVFTDPESILSTLPTGTKQFMDALYKPSSTTSVKAELAGYMTDKYFTEPARYLAGCHSKLGRRTYRYFFTYVPEADRAELPGATHAGELQFVFGTFSLNQASGSMPKADQEMASTLQRYWTNFAKTSDPNDPGLTPWPADVSDLLLRFGASGQSAEKQFRKAKLDGLQKMAEQEIERVKLLEKPIGDISILQHSASRSLSASEAPAGEPAAPTGRKKLAKGLAPPARYPGNEHPTT